MAETKVKINLREGTIELEGSQAFVEKYLDEFKSYLKLQHIQTPDLTSQGSITKKQTRQQTKKSKTGKKVSFVPLPLNLKGDNRTPSLKKFFEEKSPNTNQEIITVFAYYLKKYLNIANMQVGHALSCYNEVNKRKPNVYASFRNIETRIGWVKAGSEPYSAQITINGENCVEHDLPRKKAAQ